MQTNHLKRLGARPRLTLPCAVLAASVLSGCAPNIVGTEKAASRDMLTFCLLYQPVTHSKKDTEETKRQIDFNNSRWECVCRADCGD